MNDIAPTVQVQRPKWPWRTCIYILVMLFLGILLGIASYSTGKQEDSRDYPICGMWVVRDAMTSKEQIDQVFALAKELGLRDLMLQVNGRGEAYYNSNILPRAVLDFDPLAYAVSLGEKHDIAVHAWVNMLTASSFLSRSKDPEHVINKHPEWITYDVSGRSLLTYEVLDIAEELSAIMLDPALPEVQDFLVTVCTEIVENYTVDGLHLDYIRYPGHKYGFNPRVRQLYEERFGVDPVVIEKRRFDPHYPADRQLILWDSFRTEQLSTIVHRVYRETKGINPQLQVSAAVTANYAVASEIQFQDWHEWVEQGIVDFVVPMAYYLQPDDVYYKLKDAIVACGTGKIYAGVRAYELGDDPGLLKQLVKAALDTEPTGVILFSYNSLAEETKLQDLILELQQECLKRGEK
ncbi:MAG: family 10 glycosylhydrolase [Limnochordia bacterium]|nr:family 10 glycosylhydrolase [Limnochordia bacterium]